MRVAFVFWSVAAFSCGAGSPFCFDALAAQEAQSSPPEAGTALSSENCRKKIRTYRKARNIIPSGFCGAADSTPFVTVQRKPGPQPPVPPTHAVEDRETGKGAEHPAKTRSKFCYYRLDIKPELPKNKAMIGHVRRNGLHRYFVGANYSFTSVLKVKVGIYEESVVLYSRKYQSSRDEGENHDRTILRRGADYPVFLLRQDANGEAGVSVSADMQNVQSFSVAGSALEAVSVALKAIAPSSDIITTLTSDSAKSVAQKIDAGAGAFASSTGNNQERSDLNILKDDQIDVEIFGPEFEVNPNDTSYILGKWRVGFVSPFASYFYQDTQCHADAEQEAWRKKGSNAGLLTTKLVSNVSDIGTMASYLRQREWWSRLNSQMNAAPGAVDVNAVETFCRAIVDTVSELGFNTVDSYLVADAVARSSLVSPQIGAAMIEAHGCDFEKRRLPLPS